MRGAGVLAAVVALGLPAHARAQTPRSPVVPLERPRFNKLANAGFVREPSAENAPLPQWFVVSSASNTAPIELATPIPHELASGEAVAMKGVEGNEAANGWWTVLVIAPATFSLDGSEGTGTYAGGGSIFPAARLAGSSGSGASDPTRSFLGLPGSRCRRPSRRPSSSASTAAADRRGLYVRSAPDRRRLSVSRRSTGRSSGRESPCASRSREGATPATTART